MKVTVDTTTRAFVDSGSSLSAGRNVEVVADANGLIVDVDAYAGAAGVAALEAALAGLGSRVASCFFRREGSLYFDLWRANTEQLLEAGIPAGRIQLAGLCTICNSERFPSYRREGDQAGRFAAIIGYRRKGRIGTGS